MIEAGMIPNQLSENRFEIPSQTNGNAYIVSNYANKWHCTCPDHEFRHVLCKHIHAVTLWQRLSAKLREDREKRIIELYNGTFGCKFCGSLHVIKCGFKSGKQVYKCKSCARKFVSNQGFEGMCYEPRIVATTLDLYFKGVSLRKIADHLKQFYGLNMNHSTVYRWICKYTDIMEWKPTSRLLSLKLVIFGTRMK